jgi:hypothetical protein
MWLSACDRSNGEQDGLLHNEINSQSFELSKREPVSEAKNNR